MSALISDRKTDRMNSEDSVYPLLLSFPVEASTTLYGGAMVATNAAGNAVPASSSTALKLWGRCEKQTINAGAAGALQVPVRPGAYFYNSGTGADTIAQANVGSACYASDDNTVNLTDGGGTRPYAGVIVNIAPNGQIGVLVGQASPYAVDAQGGGGITHLTIPVPLATIQAQTSGTAFNIGSVLPANAQVLSTEIAVTTPISGGTLSAVVVTLQGGGDSAGTLIASTSVWTGGPPTISTPGSNPYASRGGQQLKMKLTATGDTLANATAGVLAVSVFFTELA